MTKSPTDYRGGTTANITIDEDDYGVCFFDGYHKRWISADHGSLGGWDYHDYTIDVVYSPPPPPLAEPKHKWSVVSGEDLPYRAFVRTDRDSRFPWESIGRSSGTYSFGYILRNYGPLKLEHSAA